MDGSRENTEEGLVGNMFRNSVCRGRNYRVDYVNNAILYEVVALDDARLVVDECT